MLCPNVARFFFKCFKRTGKGKFKKENVRDKHFDVARTIKCAEFGSDEDIWWLALRPSINCTGGR